MSAEHEHDHHGPANQCPTEVSRRVIDASKAESKHRAGYTTLTVRSTFAGPDSLYDVLYKIALYKLSMRIESNAEGAA